MTLFRKPRLARPAAASQEGQPVAEHQPNFTLDQSIKRARQDMGEARWAELMKEWEQ